MVIMLSARHAALTKAINRLLSSLNKYQNEINAPVNLPSDEATRAEYITGRRKKIEQAKTAIEHERDSVQAALDAYALMADHLQQDPNTQAKEELQRTAKMNVERTVEHLDAGIG